MAVKRIKPIQDTFIVRTESGASFGGDEILELGTCYRPDASGCSRILLEFMTSFGVRHFEWLIFSLVWIWIGIAKKGKKDESMEKNI